MNNAHEVIMAIYNMLMHEKRDIADAYEQISIMVEEYVYNQIQNETKDKNNGTNNRTIQSEGTLDS